MDERNHHLVSENAILDKELQETRQKITTLEETSASLRVELNAAKQDTKNLTAERDEIKHNLEKRKEEIASIGKELQETRQKKATLEGTCASLRSELNAATQDTKKLTVERDEIKNNLEKEKTECQKLASELKKINNELAPYREIYDKYKTLPSNIKENLSTIIRGGSLWEFLFSGFQEKQLEAFWNYCFYLAKEEDKAAKKLAEIFAFFFDRNNMLHEEPEYIRQKIEVGDEFDDDEAYLAADSPSQGHVSEILLPGYAYATNGKIAHKSLVRVTR